MADHERGAYAPPTDGNISFDPRQPVKGSRPAPFTLILSILVLAAITAAIFVFYRQGVRQAGQAPQVVGEAVGTMKAPAPSDAQPTDPASGLQVYKSEAGEQIDPLAPPTFTKDPEQPAPRSAPVQVAAAPQLRPALPAEPVAKAPPAPAPVEKAAPAKVVAAAPPPPKAAPAPPPKAAPAPPPKAAPATGGASVQVGAVASTALADKAWNDAVAAAPGLAAGKGKSVTKVEGQELYRTLVTGFASRTDAVAFCDRLKAAGKACFVR